MDKRVKARWLAALRSRKYKKATGTLRARKAGTDEVAGYCCLGVLCDITKKRFKVDWVTYLDDSFAITGDGIWRTGALPEEIRASLKISLEDHEQLVDLNDENKGWRKVIQYIEKKM